ncbi:MAG: hypothetical protein ACXWKP_03220 [Bradyrhizobium sp.]
MRVEKFAEGDREISPHGERKVIVRNAPRATGRVRIGLSEQSLGLCRKGAKQSKPGASSWSTAGVCRHHRAEILAETQRFHHANQKTEDGASQQPRYAIVWPSGVFHPAPPAFEPSARVYPTEQRAIAAAPIHGIIGETRVLTRTIIEPPWLRSVLFR